MNDLVDMQALDAHFASIARRVYLEEHAKEAGVSKRKLHEKIRMLVQQQAFSQKDAAKYLGRSASFVANLVKRGQLATTVNGNSKYYRKQDLDDWINSGITAKRAI